MKIDLTNAAVSDLQSIHNYTLQKWGEEQGDSYLDEMWARFEEILSDSKRWRFREDLFPKCQLAPQGKHVILFRIEGDILQIVRVLHSAMDFSRHIPDNL